MCMYSFIMLERFRANFGFFLILFLCVSCTGAKHNALPEYPGWVADPYSVSKDKMEIAAVGVVTCFGPLDHIGLQMSRAELDARSGIADQIMTKITRASEVLFDAAQSGDTHVSHIKIGTTKTSKDEPSVVTRMNFKQVIKESVNELPVVGATRTHIYRDKENNMLFIRMVLKSDRAQRYIDGVILRTLDSYHTEHPKDKLEKGINFDSLKAESVNLISAPVENVSTHVEDIIAPVEREELVVGRRQPVAPAG